MDTDKPVPVNEPIIDDRMMAEAIEWFVRRRDEHPDPAIERPFAAWIASDPRHAQAYADIASLWIDLDAIEPPKPSPDAWHEPTSRRAVRWRRWVGGAFAASIALTLANEGPSLWMMAFADARSPAGIISEVTLPDGTHVSLDAGSAIDTSIGADARHVTLLEGRAWFRIVHESRPFTVSIDGAQVRDIGTAFEVARLRDGGEVTVTAGAAEITRRGGRALRLVAGEAARFTGDGTSRKVEPVPGAAAWRVGRLQFVDMKVCDILDELRRYGAGNPVFFARSIANQRITGAVDLASPTAASDAILARVGGSGRRIGPWLVVTSR